MDVLGQDLLEVTWKHTHTHTYINIHISYIIYNTFSYKMEVIEWPTAHFLKVSTKRGELNKMADLHPDIDHVNH